MPDVKRRQSRWSDLFEPRALEGRLEGSAFGAACLVVIALVTVADIQTGMHVTVGSFLYIPLIASAWLLSDRWVVGVSVAALVSRVVGVELHGISPLTAAVQMSVIPFVAIVARTAAVSVRAARDQAEREMLTSRISSMASSSASLQEILDGILGLVAREGLRGGTIALIDERERLYIAAAEGEVDPDVLALRLPVGEGVMGRAAKELRPVLVEDLWSDSAPDSPTRGVGANSSIRSIVAVPLVTAGRAVGVLECDSEQPNRFDSSDVAFLEQAAVAVTGAVQRAGALQLADQQLQRRVRELTILLDAARGVASSLDLPVVLQTVCQSAADIAVAPAARGRRASVVRVEADHCSVIADHDERGNSIAGASFSLGDSEGVMRAFRSGSATRTTHDDVRGELGRVVAPLGVAVAAAAPIRVSAAIWGVLMVSTEDEYDFTESDLRLLQATADLAGLAIANAELLRLERRRSEQLREHGERMAALDHAKSEFLRLASHELRGPLGVVRGYISMLAEGSLGDLPGAAERIMPILSTKVAEMNLLIDQMLETARLEDSRLQLALEQFDLRTLVEDVVGSFRGRLDTEHVVEISVPSAPVIVHADRARIATVLSNLVDNAIKYSPAGGTVRCVLLARGDEAHVSVTDEGLGIAPADLGRLFTRFGRLVTSENSHIAGTGLGLYLSRELARMHQGDISVTSTPGKGSCFTLELPVTLMAPSAASA